MADFINGIIAFFTGEEFRNIMTSAGAIILALSPFLYKLIVSKFDKWKIRLQGKSEELKEALSLVAKLEQKAKKEAIQMNALVNQVNAMMKSQSEAMALAFSRSNLKEDVKGTITNILNNSTKPIEIEIPSGQVEEDINTTIEEVEIDNRPLTETETRTAEEKKKYVRGY